MLEAKSSRNPLTRAAIPPKVIANRLLQQHQLASLRYALWLGHAQKDAKATRNFAQQSGIPPVNIWETPILPTPDGQVLFILGSGSSINDLKPHHFAHIGNHQSIGVNFWYFHDFVPNVFSFDAGRADPGHKDLDKTLVKMGRLFDRKPILESRPKILYLRPLNSDRKQLMPVPRELAAHRWVSSRANLISTNQPALESDLRLMLRKIATRSFPQTVLPDNGSSVVRMIFLGLARGYRDIILTGVDLDERPHFWYSQAYVSRYQEYTDLFPTPENAPHGTTQAINRPLGNQEFLASLGKVMAEEGAGRLWVSSHDSRLEGSLPRYTWPSD